MSGTGVVTVTYGSPNLLDDHLAATDLPPGSVVVVVDNHSTDDVRAAVEARCTEHGWTFVAMPGNPGFGAACNRGADAAFAAGCDVVLLLNPDATAPPGVLAALAEHCRADPMSMTAPALEQGDGSVRPSWHGLDLTRGRNVRRPEFDGRSPGDWLGAACLAVGRPLWEATGGFDETYFMYWEDVDLSRRAQDAGGRLVARPDLVVGHAGGATQGASKSPLYMDMNCRNRLRYAALRLPPRARWRWVLHTPRESARIALRVGKRGLVRRPSLLWATVRGTLAGLALVVRAGR